MGEVKWKVKWIKIVTDIFDDEKILLIENIPEADSVIVIWFKLLCLAGKMNNSGVFMLNEKIAYTDEMLATIFRRPLNTVRLAINTFEQFGMIEVIDNVITIPNWSKHQTLDQLEERKEYMREYMKGYREKQKLLAGGNKVPQGGLPLKDWKDTINYFNNECAYCGNKNCELEQEHVRPFSKGGDYSKGNIVPACRSCNGSKNNKDIDEWYFKQDFYDEERYKKIVNFCKVNNVNLRKVNVSSLEEEGEEDIDIDIEEDIDSTTKVVSSNKLQPIVDKWNSLNLNKLVSINNGTNRYKLTNARIKEYGLETVLEAIDNIRNSSFLRGQNKKGWTIKYDWFIKPNNFIKVLENNYIDGEEVNGGTKQDFSGNKKQEYDFSKYEG
ncbi:phage replisome organizer N-terminal domain-containing protein [Clostridium botulinum]|nr:phage replisome organizer N-terminal domain-containing protein [Clostridium botulinum]